MNLCLGFMLTVFFMSSSVSSQKCELDCGLMGRCIIKDNSPTCICADGFIGSRCQEIDPCLSKPCGVGGQCVQIVRSESQAGGNVVDAVGFRCACYPGYYGSNCQNYNSLPCTSTPCLNNGICVNKNNSWDYTCICPINYGGKNCASRAEICQVNLCNNGGTCLPGPDQISYSCVCARGFTGEFCDYEINECNSMPCRNGAACFDLVDGYLCECKPTYSGTNCETNLNSQSSPNYLYTILLPILTAMAIALPAALVPSFLLRQSSRQTITVMDPCLSSPCSTTNNSYCQKTDTGYVCKCLQGFFGSKCLRDPCVSNPCKFEQRNSTCVPVDTQGVCANKVATFVCTFVDGSPKYGVLNLDKC